MAINLVFLVGTKNLFMIRIDGTKVFWNDKLSGLQMLLPTPSAKAIRMGGAPSKEDMMEYKMCTTEEELVSFVIRDCKSKGARLIKREDTK